MKTPTDSAALDQTSWPPIPDHAHLWQVLEQEYLRLHLRKEATPAAKRHDHYERFVRLRDWLNARRATELLRLTLAEVSKVRGARSSEAIEAGHNLPRLEENEKAARARLESMPESLLSHKERRTYEKGKKFDQAAYESQGRRHRPEGAAKRMRTQLEESYDGLILRALYAEFHRLPPGEHSALCLSGGGIRSATFGLGVLQGLARHRFLQKFTYLSTVSGGGYIGGWLSAWLRNSRPSEGQTRERAREVVFEKLGFAPGNAGQDLHNHSIPGSPEPAPRVDPDPKLGPPSDEDPRRRRPDPLQPEAQPVEHLRRFSNYLTPRLGSFSADTWTIIATVFRNLLLTWLVIVPPIMILLLVPRIVAAVITAKAGGAMWLQVTVSALGIAAAAVALRHLFRAPRMPAPPDRGQARFRNCALWPLCVAAMLLLCVWSWALQFPDAVLRLFSDTPIPWWQRGAAFGAIAGVLALLTCGRTPRAATEADAPRHQKIGVFVQVGRFLLVALVCVLAGAGLGWGGGKMEEAVRRDMPNLRKQQIAAEEKALEKSPLLQDPLAGDDDGDLVSPAPSQQELLKAVFVDRFVPMTVCLGPSVFFLTLSVAFSILVGLRSNTMPDSWREWYARANGWCFIAGVAWALLSAIVLWGPDWAYAVFQHYTKSTSVVGLLAGLLTIFGGTGSASPANKRQKQKAGLPAIAMQFAIKLAAPIFAVLLLVGLVSLTSVILQAMTPVDLGRHPGHSAHELLLHQTSWQAIGILVLGGAAISCLMGRYVNVNKFSLNAMYRNRLIRAYLGASRRREDRSPDPFTGFDSDDNFPMHELRDQRPFHVLNIALNVVGGDELAWQDRQAESFVVTPLVCGSRQLGYRRSTAYALGEDNIPMTLGTAISISGAAASPNHGYNSSAPVAFLMTLFNARLGAWLGNPGKAGDQTYKDEGPRFAMGHLAKEALGLTNDAEPYVNLSDGGHFENLGLYEMVLRRCSFIVVSDAGCDPDYNFEDLGNAIAKIRIDLGIPITFEGEIPIYPRSKKKRPASDDQRRYAVIGSIHYAAVDGELDGELVRCGTLVYLKPALCKAEPIDVFHYAQENESFPHEPTSDQWFSEAQFESYRALGFHAIDHICRREIGDKKAGDGKKKGGAKNRKDGADPSFEALRELVMAHMKSFAEPSRDASPAAAVHTTGSNGKTPAASKNGNGSKRATPQRAPKKERLIVARQPPGK